MREPQHPPRPRVTMAEIARQARVSEPTVSKVLNDRSDVAPATRERVRALLAQNGYTPRRKRKGADRMVDLVMIDLTTPWAAEILRGAEQEAHRQRRALVITVTHDRNADPRDWIASLAARRSDGVVLVMSKLETDAARQLAALDIPLVLIDPIGGFDPMISTVRATNWAGGFAATDHLIQLGHTRIGIITGPTDIECSLERLDGYRAALGRAGLPVDAALVRYGNFRADGGRREATALLDLDDPPTAIFAGSDQHAGGVYIVARERGLRIPDDLSVVGFDDVQLAEWLDPPLTTIHQPLAEMARIATRTILEPPAGSRPDRPQHIEMSTSLLQRASTAPPVAGRRNVGQTVAAVE